MTQEQIKEVQEMIRYRRGVVQRVGYTPFEVEADALEALLAEREELLKDKARMDAIKHNSWDVCCHDIPTGGGDADIGWLVVEHHIGAPSERVIGRDYNGNPRAAIDAAMKGGE